MATMHYFWMKFDCLQASPTGGGRTAAASMAAPGSKEIVGGTVRSHGGGGSGGAQGTGIQGGTVRPGGGDGAGGSGSQAAAPDGGAVTYGATVRSRAEIDTAKAGVISFNLLHERAGGIIGNGRVSFYCIDGQTAIRFPDEASALKEKNEQDFTRWVGNSVAVLACIETP